MIVCERIALMYHDLYLHSPSESGFQNDSAFQYKIQVNEFEKQVKVIVEYCREHPETEVEFTFDDGGVSFLTLVAPVLEKYGLRGTFFISTAYLNTPLFLTTEQVAELARRGHHIGSHSHTHPVLTELGKGRIAGEWYKSVEILKDYASGEVIASIPNGNGNRTVMQKAAEAGIRKLYTSVPTTRITNQGDMQILGRYVVYQGMTVEDVLGILDNKKKRQKLYVRWKLLSVLKGCLGRQYARIKCLYFRLKHKR